MGFVAPRAFDGKICVQGTAEDIMKMNMFLHTAERVYIKLTSFHAETFDQLYDNTFSFNWADFIPFNAKIIVNGKSKKSKLFSLRDCQSIIKKSILNKLAEHYHRHLFPENGVAYGIEFSITDDEVMLLLDCSGMGLHKRGYRDLVGGAPIKETLACAMLYMSDFSADKPFADPFCGSGTIVIEAALMALNIAPCKNRKFACEYYDFLPYNIKNLMLERANDLEIRNKELFFIASDIDSNAISLCVRHAYRAGVKEKLKIVKEDVKDFYCKNSDGCIVTNPPYGERMMTPKEVEALYGTLGKVWKNLDNWSLNVITSAPNFEKALGTRCDSQRKFFHADKECRYYQYKKQQPLDK